MIKGFTFNGQHCSQFDVAMTSKDRTVLPASNDVYLQIPGRDGSYLFSGKLADRVIEIDCGLRTSTVFELRQRIREIAAWLQTTERVQLIFDDEPGRYYLAKCIGAIGLTRLQAPGMGIFSLQFRCDPTAYSIAPVTLSFGEYVFYGPRMFFQAEPAGSLGVTNSGTKETHPKLTVTFTSEAAEFTAANGSEYVRVVNTFVPGDVLVIDCELFKITLNGVVCMTLLDWANSTFFSLPVGVSTLTVSPVDVATVTVAFVERWL